MREGLNLLSPETRAYLEASVGAQAAREAEETARYQMVLRQASAGLAAQALRELDGATPERGILLALAALEHYPYTPQAECALTQAIHANRPYHVLTLPGDMGVYNRTAWSPDGKYLAVSASIGKAVAILWDMVDYREICRLTREKREACTTHDVAWSPDGTRVVISRGVAHRSECHSIEVWDIRTEAILFQLAGHQGDPGAVDWSPDGTAILTVGMDGKAKIWDATTGAERLTIRVMVDPPSDLPYYFEVISDAVWSPIGDCIATAARDKVARIWDAVTGAELLSLHGHTGPLTSVTWAPEGQRLATASKDGTVRVWDVVTGETLLLLSHHKGIVRSVAWSPNGRRLATAGEDGTVRVWHAATGMEEFVFRAVASPWHVTWSPDSKRLAIKGFNVWVLDFSNEPCQRLYGCYTGESRCAMWSPDGTRILTHSASTAWLWDAVHEKELQVFKYSKYFHQPWSPDGTRIVTADEEGPLRIWDVETGKVLSELQPPTRRVVLPAWSPDGSRIVACLMPEAHAIVWDVVSGEILSTTDEVEGGGCLYGPMWSPDGQYFVTGCAFVGGDTPVRVWDAVTGRELMALESHNGESILANWSPEGGRIAVTYEDGTIKVWNVSSLYSSLDGPISLADSHQSKAARTIAGQVLLTLAGHVGRVWWVTWSPNGKRVASGGIDSVVRVWDATTGAEVGRFQAPSEVATLNWSPDGKYLVAGGRYTTPIIWRVWQSTKDLIEYTHRYCISRDLTPEERQRFILLEQ